MAVSRSVKKYAETAVCGRNLIIESLPVRQRKGFLALCEHIELPPGTTLCHAGTPFEYVYFPVSGTISMMTELVGCRPLETESLGCEGMMGATMILNEKRATQTGIVQTHSLMMRIKARTIAAALIEFPVLRRLMQRYLYFLHVEQQQSAACFHLHDVPMRLAKGLLHTQDRVNSDHLLLTHQQLSESLGVRRGGVTIAALALQQAGIIQYSRGKIIILDRVRLEESACDCYRMSQQRYSSLFS